MVLATKVYAEPVYSNWFNRCRVHLSRLSQKIEEMKDRPTFSDLSRLSRERIAENLKTVVNMGLKPAKSYEDIDVYPDPDAYKRSIVWEDILDRYKEKKVEVFAVTLKEPTPLAIAINQSEFSSTVTLPAGSTVLMSMDGTIIFYQQSNEPSVLLVYEGWLEI